jgi:hypothetical protein
MDDTTADLVRLFHDALDPTDSIRVPAEQSIMHLFNVDIQTLLRLCCAIVTSDRSLPHSAHCYSFIIFNRAFTPTELFPISIVETHWFQDLTEEDRTAIRIAIVRGLMFATEDIWRPAAHIVSLIVHLDRRVTTDLFAQLITLLESEQYAESVHYAALEAVIEIYGNAALAEMP